MKLVYKLVLNFLSNWHSICANELNTVLSIDLELRLGENIPSRMLLQGQCPMQHK